MVSAVNTVSSLLFTGPLTWTSNAACRGQNELFFAPAGERPEAREHREYGFWGGESEEERAAAGYRVDMPVGRVARYPKGDGTPVAPRAPRVA